MKNIIYIFVLLISVIAISCGDGECNLETDSILVCDIQVLDTTLIDAEFLENLSVYSTDWLDTINYSETGAINFTLSPNDTTTEIIFTSKTYSGTDTVIFYHQNEIVFLSTECGFVINYKIDTVISTYNNIDSLEFINREISTSENGEVQIYF